ncbi:MAG: DNA polymerase III subunit delta [Flavobacteriia bacterium]|nr:DNA polymerase III subunit delta [Flavobacteriia bacterium]
MFFKDVIGQNELKSHLIREIKNEKVSHAQLFLGQSGYGTLPLALAFIQYLFCENKRENDSCGVCASCKKNLDLQHPDIHFTFPIVLAEDKFCDPLLPRWREIIKEKPYFSYEDWTEKIDKKLRKPVIGTDESAQIVRKLALKSYEGGYKVLLIWKADEMNHVFANKILKILEEPPEKTLIILIAENQENLLQTIVSRTQIVKIPFILQSELSAHIQNKFSLESSLADSIASQSEGNYIQASYLISGEDIQAKNREIFIQLMRCAFKKNAIDMINWAEEISQFGKEKQKNFLTYSLYMLRHCLLKNYQMGMLSMLSKEEEEFLKNFARFITNNNIFKFYDFINQAYFFLDRNANPKLVFTNMAFNSMRYIHLA